MRSMRLTTLLISAAVSFLPIGAVVGAAETPVAGAYKAPTNHYGQPDLEGTWTNATLTVLERPKEYGTRKIMTPDEVKKVEGDDAKLYAADAAPRDPNFKTADLPHDCGKGFSGAGCGEGVEGGGLRLHRGLYRSGDHGDGGKRRAAQLINN